MNVFQREIDVSDPFTFLFLKRGILRKYLALVRFSRHNPNFSRICSSQASPRDCFASVEGIRKIQRRRISCRFRVPLCQYSLQCQYLSKLVLLSYVLALDQRRSQAISVSVNLHII